MSYGGKTKDLASRGRVTCVTLTKITVSKFCSNQSTISTDGEHQVSDTNLRNSLTIRATDSQYWRGMVSRIIFITTLV